MLTISCRDRPQGLKEFFYGLAGSGMHECTMILFLHWSDESEWDGDMTGICLRTDFAARISGTPK